MIAAASDAAPLEEFLILLRKPIRFFPIFFVFIAIFCSAQTPATSGEFVLYKFASPIGNETYTIQTHQETYTLASHFLFTDRGSAVPLETTYVASRKDGAPVTFETKGRVARMMDIDDQLRIKGNTVEMHRSGKTSKIGLSGKWFVTDGYSPVAMQEQMMRWWLAHGRPPEFTVYPSGATVHILPSKNLILGGQTMHGYTVGGLIWGQESLWMDDARNLVALVSIDAEFDHFEAVRVYFAKQIGVFIEAAVKADLAALAKLSGSARMKPSAKLAIVGATIEDSVSGKAIPDGVILIEDGVIRAVGSRTEVQIPQGAKRLDATGKFAIPGLWDMHAHYEQVEWGPIYLASGVTGVRDAGNEFDFIRVLHEQLNGKGTAIGPRLEFAGVIDGKGSMSIGTVLADTPEQAIPLVDKYEAAGARQIKIYSSVNAETLKAITAKAHSLGLTVTGHVPEGLTALDGINDGMDQINHLPFLLPYFTKQPTGADGKPDRKKPLILELDSERGKELLRVLQEHHTVIDPTLAVYEMLSHTAPYDQLEPGLKHLPPQLQANLDTPPAPEDMVPVVKARQEATMAVMKKLHEAKIPIVAGTDQTIPGYSLHRELELYVEAGYSPLEALQTATIEAAKALGLEKESGSLTTGKRGDVILLDADPLQDIHNTRKIWRTVSAGAVYDPALLWKSVDFQP